MGWGCASCGGTNPDGTRFCGHCGTPSASKPDHVAEERRLVTSLFADISGFTTLSEQIDDPEALHGIIAPVIFRLAGIAERYGGTIAKYAGDALLVFFGAPVAHEDDAARALLVALDMHRELPSILADLPDTAKGLSMHIGVNTGRVISGQFGGEIRNDYSILGDAVILAQRLESVAGSGETFVGESTMELTKDQFEFESVGPLSLKGKTKAIPGYRLLGTRQLPMISGTAFGAPTTPLIGRDTELRQVEQMLRPLVQDRKGGLISLSGEPGVGKSRFLRAIRERAAVSGVRWYQARCLTYGSTLPYWPAIDLLRQVMGFRVEDPPDVVLTQLEVALTGIPHAVPYFARLLGLPAGDALDDLEPEAFRRGLHRAFCDWVELVAAGGPIILAIEDMHWADSASLALGGELAALGESNPIVMIVTMRPEGEEVATSIAEGLTSVPWTHIPLARFEASATRLFLRALLDGEPPSRLVAVVADRTSGNPLFIEEIVRALQEMGSLEFDGTRWLLAATWQAADVPDTIERLLSARIDLLPPSTAGLLQTAAVVGRVIRRSLIAAMAEDLKDLDSELERLMASGYFDATVDAGEDAVMFHHALVQDVSYGRILKRRRRDLHRQVVDTAENLYGSGDDVIDLLARHAYLGETGVKAVNYLGQAGDRSRRIFANDQAIQHFQRAVEVAEGNKGEDESLAERVPGLKLALAEMEDLVGEFEEAARLYDAVRTSTSDIQAWKGLAYIAFRRGDIDGALRLIEEAFVTESLVGADMSPLWIQRAIVLFGDGRYLDAIEASQTGLAAIGDPESEAAGHLLARQARAETLIGRRDDALAHANQALKILEQNGDLRGQTTALRVLGNIYAEAGHHEAASDALRRALPLAERTGNVEEMMGCLVNLGNAEIFIGDFDNALKHNRQALEEAERVGHTIGQEICLVNIADALEKQGNPDEAEPFCQRALELTSDHTWNQAEGRRVMASISLQREQFVEAWTWAEKAATQFLELGDESSAAVAFDVAAHAAQREGDNRRAQSFSDRALTLRAT